MHLSRKKEQRTRTKPNRPTSKDHAKPRVSYRASSNSSRPSEKSHRQTRPYIQPKQIQTPKVQPITTQNMFVFSETESEDEGEHEVEHDTQRQPSQQTPETILKHSVETRIYTVEHIQGLKLLGFISTYSLPKEVCLILDTYTENCKLIHQQYMEHDKRKRPYKRNYKKRKNPHYKKQRSEVTAEDFAIVRDFKKTEIKRNEEGVAKTKSIIRSYLNKITDKTYQKMNENIQQELQALIDNGANSSDYEDLSYFIFDVASSNQFFGKLYAELFDNLLEYLQKQECSFMADAMNTRLNEYSKAFLEVRTADPVREYDEFCKINKENERRRAFFGFLGCLITSKHISSDWIGELIHSIVNRSISWIYKKEILENEMETKRYIEEFSEVVFVFIKQAGTKAVLLNLWEPIFKNCLAITQLKTSDYLLPPKAKFRYMDMIDVVKKWDISEE